MARKFPPLGDALVKQIETAWSEPQEEWARQRLRVVRLIAQHELTAAEIMRVCDVSRQTIFTYRDTVVAKGVSGLLHRDWKGARKPAVRGAVAEEFIQRLEAGQFRQARDAQAWIKKRTRQSLSESGVRKILRRLGGKLKVPRKSHAKKDPAKAAKFKLELPARLTELAGVAPSQPVRLWVLDEHRYGLLPVIRRVWARRGVRVHAPYATKYQWGYLHEALEVDGAHRAELLFTLRSIETSTRSSSNKSPPPILSRCMWSSRTKPAFTCQPTTRASPKLSGCCPCHLTARNSIQWNVSAAC